jgi:cell division topological specificity factor
MAGFLDRVRGRISSKTSSATTAKERLQFVLVHDRIDLPPERIREMKEEILAVISKYVDIDRERVDIALEQRDRVSSALVAEIPFSRTRKDAEPKNVPAEETLAAASPPQIASATDTPATGENGEQSSDQSSDAPKSEAKTEDKSQNVPEAAEPEEVVDNTDDTSKTD